MNEFLSTSIHLITDFGLKLIGAAVVLFFGFKLSKALSHRLPRARSLSKFDEGIRGFLAKALKVSLCFLTVITAAGILGIPYASFVAVLGSAGIAIGLALQGSLSNIAAGILILFNKPFRVGDFIEADGIKGTVKDIGLFTTVITSIDNKVMYYPNSALSNKCIINYSENEMRRVDMDFSISYSSDTELAKNILMKLAYEHPLTVDTPEPFARLTRHDDSALIITLRVWCKNADYWDVYFDLMESVKKAFDMNGIEIPFSQLDVHIKSKGTAEK